MKLTINSYGLNLGNSKSVSPFANSKDKTVKLIANGKSIELTKKEENIPAYLQQIREQNEQLKREQIMAKAESGSDLSPEELAYLKEKDPDLYRQIMQERQFQKQFEQQLKNCKTKKEAQELYLHTQIMVGKICSVHPNSSASIPDAKKKKYNRLMKRIQESYSKYLSGKLKDDPKTASKSGIKDAAATVIATLNKDKKGNIYDSQI